MTVKILIAVWAVVISSAPCAFAGGDGDAAHLAAIAVGGPTDDAIDKALAWMSAQQDREQGFLPGSPRNTVTALFAMSLMATGHFPGRSQYGDGLQRAIAFLIAEGEKQSGYFGKDGGRMYGHGICTLALCEAYGMMGTQEENRRIRQVLKPALQLILDGQLRDRQDRHLGGWRYHPKSKDADLSVSAWQILVLRAAHNCQFDVPQKALDDALTYLRANYNQATPGFAYQGGSASAHMRAAGVVGMLALGGSQSPEDKKRIADSIGFLNTFNPQGGHGHYYYLMYYAATAANMMGKKEREAHLPKMETALLRLQNDDGQFRKHSGHAGGVYATAFSVICLAVNYQYLPIYQE